MKKLILEELGINDDVMKMTNYAVSDFENVVKEKLIYSSKLFRRIDSNTGERYDDIKINRKYKITDILPDNKFPFEYLDFVFDFRIYNNDKNYSNDNLGRTSYNITNKSCIISVYHVVSIKQLKEDYILNKMKANLAHEITHALQYGIVHNYKIKNVKYDRVVPNVINSSISFDNTKSTVLSSIDKSSFKEYFDVVYFCLTSELTARLHEISIELASGSNLTKNNYKEVFNKTKVGYEFNYINNINLVDDYNKLPDKKQFLLDLNEFESKSNRNFGFIKDFKRIDENNVIPFLTKVQKEKDRRLSYFKKRVNSVIYRILKGDFIF